jgi:hypothetical protein
MKLPSIDNENLLTWKCKVFGCRNNELLGFSFHEGGERHGVIGLGKLTATTTLIESAFRGCHWCQNWTKSLLEEKDCWPKWQCDCEVCEAVKVKENDRAHSS